MGNLKLYILEIVEEVEKEGNEKLKNWLEIFICHLPNIWYMNLIQKQFLQKRKIIDPGNN